MSTHAERWLSAFADALVFLARHPGRIRVHVTSDATESSSRIGLSNGEARAVASLLNGVIKLQESATFSDIDIVESIRQAPPGDSRPSIPTTAASLMVRLREKFGDDSLPEGLVQHLSELSEDTLEKIAAGTETANSLSGLLGSHYPAFEPPPACLKPVQQVPRHGTDVWLLVSSRVDIPIDEFVVAKWDAATKRWISHSAIGLWPRYDSDVKGWFPLDAPRNNPAIRKAIRRRWQGTGEELRQLLGDDGGQGE